MDTHQVNSNQPPSANASAFSPTSADGQNPISPLDVNGNLAVNAANDESNASTQDSAAEGQDQTHSDCDDASNDDQHSALAHDQAVCDDSEAGSHGEQLACHSNDRLQAPAGRAHIQENLRPGVALARWLQTQMNVANPQLLEETLVVMLQESQRRLRNLAWVQADHRRRLPAETAEQLELQARLWQNFWTALGINEVEE